MIYLAKHRILFLKPRKVGGTSFEIALSRFAGPRDIITPISEEDEAVRTKLGFRGPQNHLLSGRDEKNGDVRTKENLNFFNHMPAARVRAKIGAKTFQSAMKVSIVRNPFDRIVSTYFWNMRDRDEKVEFIHWIRSRPDTMNENDKLYFIGDRDIVDFYIRYDCFEHDINMLENARPELSGLREQFMHINAKGGIRPKAATPQAMFAGHPDLISAVRFFNQRHFERFGFLDPA